MEKKRSNTISSQKELQTAAEKKKFAFTLYRNWSTAIGEVQLQNRSFLRSMKIAQAEGRDWRKARLLRRNL